MARNRQRKPKEVEVDIERNSVNKADLRKSDKRKDYNSGKDATKCKPGENDASWYTFNSQLAKDVASLNFAQPLGTKISWNMPTIPGNITSNIFNKSVAGIAVLEYMPTIGPASGSSADPVNVAANSLYTFVRRNVSTYANYDAPDLMEYILALDSAYQQYAIATRVYGLMQSYYVYNRYYARAVVNALGFSFDQLSTQLADFRALINQYAFKLAQFCVPSEIAYIKRHLWMALNIFYDSESVKAQTYAFAPNGFYQFTEQVNGPAKLTYKYYSDYKDSASGLLDLNAINNIFNDSILPIMESQDCIAMSGDILRAFGSDKLFVIPALAENYLTAQVMSYEVLSQFENATLVGGIVSSTTVDDVTYSPDITQRVELDFGGVGLQQNIAFYPSGFSDAAAGLIAGAALQRNIMLNMHKNDPTIDDVFVATRLSNIFHIVSQQTPTTGAPFAIGVLDTYGSEVGLSITFTYFEEVGSAWQSVKSAANYSIFLDMNNGAGNVTALCERASLWSQFDWCPTFTQMVSKGSNAYGLTQMQDTDNFEILTEADLRNLSQTALLSEFSVQGVLEMAAKPVN